MCQRADQSYVASLEQKGDVFVDTLNYCSSIDTAFPRTALLCFEGKLNFQPSVASVLGKGCCWSAWELHFCW